MPFKAKLTDYIGYPALAACTASLLLLSACSNPDAEHRPVHWKVNQREDNPLGRDIIVERNMGIIQTAVEHYAADHGMDKYPTELDESFQSYFPGGDENRVATQIGLLNPFTAEFEFPIFVSKANSNAQEIIKDLPPVSTVEELKKLRSGRRFALKKGTILIVPSADAKGYAIVGGAHDDLALIDHQNHGQILVLSNLDWPNSD